MRNATRKSKRFCGLAVGDRAWNVRRELGNRWDLPSTDESDSSDEAVDMVSGNNHDGPVFHAQCWKVGIVRC
jgi:hypothetical protein